MLGFTLAYKPNARISLAAVMWCFTVPENPVRGNYLLKSVTFGHFYTLCYVSPICPVQPSTPH